LGDRMIRASSPYDPAWAAPVDPARFRAWADGHGELRYWPATRCAPRPAGEVLLGYRYMLNELQGVRGIAELSRYLARAHDARASHYFAYASQVIGFYAIEGGDDPVARLDRGEDKREHYAMAALDLYAASGDPRWRGWAQRVWSSVLDTQLKAREGFLV